MGKFVQSPTESSISLQPILSLLLSNFIHKHYQLLCLLSYLGIISSDKIANVTFRLYYVKEVEYSYNEKSFSVWNIIFSKKPKQQSDKITKII